MHDELDRSWLLNINMNLYNSSHLFEKDKRNDSVTSSAVPFGSTTREPSNDSTHGLYLHSLVRSSPLRRTESARLFLITWKEKVPMIVITDTFRIYYQPSIFHIR
jgi:hypothetical protein